MVDRYRLLTEVSPTPSSSTRRVAWSTGTAPAPGSRVSGSSDEAQAEAFAKYYGHPITTFLHPADVNQVAERLAQLTEPVSSSSTARSGSSPPTAPSTPWRSRASAPRGPVSPPTRSSPATSRSARRPRPPTATGPAWSPTCPTPSSASTPRGGSSRGTRRPRTPTAGPRRRCPGTPSARWCRPTGPTARPSSSAAARPPPQGRFVGRRARLHRPAGRRRHAAVGMVVVCTELTDAARRGRTTRRRGSGTRRSSPP